LCSRVGWASVLCLSNQPHKTLLNNRSHAPAWERIRDAPASQPGGHGCVVPTNNTNSFRFFSSPSELISMLDLPAGGAFFSLLAQRKEPKEKAALPLRRPRSPRCETGGAKTRCAQTVCPFIRSRTPPPGSAPTAPHRARIILIQASHIPTGGSSVAFADDTVLGKTGEKMELVSCHHDHATYRSKLGYQMLQVGYHNGARFYPVDFGFHTLCQPAKRPPAP